MIKGNEIILLARNNAKPTSNILVYYITKKEFVVCSNLTQTGNEITWNWGHYYNDLKSAMLKLYENEIYNLENDIKVTMYNNIIGVVDKMTDRETQNELYTKEEETEKYITDIFKKMYEEE